MKIKHYILLGVVSFFVFVIVMFPANLLWRGASSSFEDKVPGKIESVSGTVWDGFFVLNVTNKAFRDRYLVQWELHPWSLLMAKISLSLHVESSRGVLAGRGHIGLLSSGVDGLNGNVDANVVDHWLSQAKASVGGLLTLKNITIVIASKQIDAASGHLNWSGGDVSYRDGGTKKTVIFPRVDGTLSEVEQGLLLAVVESKHHKSLGEAMMRVDGIGGVKVLQRVMSLAGMSSVGSDDDILFNIQKPLF